MYGLAITVLTSTTLDPNLYEKNKGKIFQFFFKGIQVYYMLLEKGITILTCIRVNFNAAHLITPKQCTLTKPRPISQSANTSGKYYVQMRYTFDDLPNSKSEVKWLISRKATVKFCSIFQSSLQWHSK